MLDEQFLCSDKKLFSYVTRVNWFVNDVKPESRRQQQLFQLRKEKITRRKNRRTHHFFIFGKKKRTDMRHISLANTSAHV